MERDYAAGPRTETVCGDYGGDERPAKICFFGRKRETGTQQNVHVCQCHTLKMPSHPRTIHLVSRCAFDTPAEVGQRCYTTGLAVSVGGNDGNNVVFVNAIR